MRNVFMSSSPRRDALASLVILTVVITFALIGLAFDANWPKMLRVSLAFAAYASVLIYFVRGSVSSGKDSLPFYWFSIAGAVAGIISGVVRPQINIAVLVVGAIGAATLFAGIHWLGLRTWRRIAREISSQKNRAAPIRRSPVE